jgi:hypothetical protein
MYLKIPTWLAFLFLCIASFAPVASAWRGWWVVYYGALLACWILVSVAAMRGVARDERKAKRKLDRMRQRLRDVTGPAPVDTGADPVGPALVEEPRMPTLSVRRPGAAKDRANGA